MKTARVSKSIMDKLSATGYAIGRKYAYSVRGRYILATRKVFGEDKEEIVRVVIRDD